MISQEETIQIQAPMTLAQRRAFMKLPVEERRRFMAQRADEMAQYHESEAEQIERGDWQGGDIVEY